MSKSKTKSSGFLNNEQATVEKLKQLTNVLKGKLSEEELSEMITKRRLTWLEENLAKLKEKYKNLPPQEQAHKIIFLEHMNINPKSSKVTRVTPNKIRIDSYNFCPYLEACKKLGLDIRIICYKINHDCFNKMVKMIHPRLVFYRNFNNTRPFNSDYCEEYIELKEP